MKLAVISVWRNTCYEGILTMKIGLIEAAVSRLAAHVEANMAAKVTELNAEYGDYPLENIKKWYIGDIPLEIPEYPCVVVRASQFTPKEAGSTAQGENVYQCTSSVELIVIIGGRDEEERFRKLARYARGLFELANAWERSAQMYSLTWDSAWSWSSVMPKEPFLQGVVIPLQMTKVEAIY